MQDKFKLKKIKRNRKMLLVMEKFLFFFYQIGYKHREKRSDYGISLFEYFHKPWVIGCCGPILIHISAITTPPRVSHTRNPSSKDDQQNLLVAIHGVNLEVQQNRFPSNRKLLSHAN